MRQTPVAFQNLLSDQPAEEVPVTVIPKFLGVFFAEGAPAFFLQEIFQISTYAAAVLADRSAQVPRAHGRGSCKRASLSEKTPVTRKDLDSPCGGSFPDFRSHVWRKQVEAVGYPQRIGKLQGLTQGLRGLTRKSQYE
jgi:hypothetical protein